MNENEKRFLEALQLHAHDHDATLKPHPFYKDKFLVTYFYVDGHEELFLTVRALLYVCHLSLHPEYASKESEEVHNILLQHLLAISKRFLPLGEEALMDHLNLYYREEKLREGLKH